MLIVFPLEVETEDIIVLKIVILAFPTASRAGLWTNGNVPIQLVSVPQLPVV